jgi:hypothetical protein
MVRLLSGALFAWVLAVLPLAAQEGPQRGTLQKVDAAKGVVIIRVDGKDLELTVTSDTKLVDPENQDVAKRLEDPRYKAGAAVVFKADGKALQGMKLTGGAGQPQPGGNIQRGTIKKLDLDKMTIVLTVGGKDQEYGLTEETRIPDARGDTLKERLKGFKEGAAVQFIPGRKGDKDVLQGLKLAQGGDNPRPPIEKPDTSKLRALTLLGTDEYKGHKGGLYPDGKNDRPAAHEAAGLALAKKVQPLGADGKPAADGKIVLLSIGMSNTTQEFSAFLKIANADNDKNPKLVLVDGAQGGQTAARIKDPDANFWTVVDERLKKANVTREQVQVVWIKEADARPTEGWPKYAETLRDEMRQIVQGLPKRFPNIKLAYLSSRTYGGYAKSPLNPDPYAYESGFSVKWLIEEQIKGDAALAFDPAKGEMKAPWLSWGPYLWANGTQKNPDGLFYEESDFGGDGTHPSANGQRKVAESLLKFFKTDTTAKLWFVR